MDEKSLKRFEELSTEGLTQPSTDSEVDRLWQITASHDFPVDVDGAWSKLSGKLKKSNSYFLISFLKVAASILVLLGLSWAVYSMYGKTEKIEFQADDSTEEFRLPDNSSAILEKGSAISYVQSAQVRSLELKGSAFFNVEKDESIPFIITSGMLTVEVIGTSFEVIGKENAHKLAVAEGEVQVNYGSKAWVLKKGNALSIDTESSIFKEYDQLDQIFAHWKAGSFVVQNKQLENILDMLSYRHDIQVKYNSKQLRSCLISGKFNLSDLEQTLEQLAAAVEFSFELTENNLLISGEGC